MDMSFGNKIFAAGYGLIRALQVVLFLAVVGLAKCILTIVLFCCSAKSKTRHACIIYVIV